jgi:hypothetical protein
LFIWDFAVELVLGQILDWLYGQVVGFLSEFFEMMGNMGAELFEMEWVQAVTLFFSYFGWSLFGIGFVVSVCEFGIEYQTGRASVKDTAMNAVKGFMAVSLFSILPVEVYKMSVSLQGELAQAISGIPGGGDTWSVGDTALSVIGGAMVPAGGHMIFGLFIVIMMGYCVIKIFFDNLKRGGILLIQIAVGAMYMFSIPRGYIDGFVGWCKQVVAICLTAFLQTTILVAGLMVFNDHPLLGLGLMLSASEIPRIAGQFGLDTSTKANIMSAVYTTQQAVNITKTVVAAVAK